MNAYEDEAVPVEKRLEKERSPDCGFCLRFIWDDKSIVERLLGEDLGIEAIRPP